MTDDTTKKENDQVAEETKTSPLPKAEADLPKAKTSPPPLPKTEKEITETAPPSVSDIKAETSATSEVKTKSSESPPEEEPSPPLPSPTEIKTKESETPFDKLPPIRRAGRAGKTNSQVEKINIAPEMEKETKTPIIIIPKPAKKIAKPVFSFPDKSAVAKAVTDKLKELRIKANQTRTKNKQANLEKVLKYAREHNRIDNKNVRDLCGVKDERARQYLDYLEKQGKLVQINKKGPSVFYMPIMKR